MKPLPPQPHRLSRRERQVLDILLASGQATAQEIHRRLPEPPSYSAVRAVLRVMVEKGVLSHENDGPRYLYKPTMAPGKARRSLLQQMLQTLFQGSREELVAALLDPADAKIPREELDRLGKMIERARKEGR